MRVLLLDPGNPFGYAFGDPLKDGVVPFSGIFKLPNAQPTKKFLAIEAWLLDLIASNGITNIYIEEPFMGHQQSYRSIAMQAGYMTIAGMCATRVGAHCSTFANSTWRSELGLPTRGPKNVLAHPDYAAFKDRANGLSLAKRQYVKDRALEFARKQGCQPVDDNEGDACAMWYWKRDRIRAREDEVAGKTDLFAGLPV